MTTKDEALKLALEALEDGQPDDPYPLSLESKAITAIREALAEQPAQQQEPVRLRRGNILRCIETDELCTVWSTSTTGKTLVKWNANEFGAYTAEQIGELFWLEPEPNDLELAAEKSDNYAAFHAGYRFAVAHSLAEQPNIAKYLEKDNSEQLAQQTHCNDCGGFDPECPLAQPAQQQEPFGYFRPEPFGWTDCAETDDGAIALYERPPARKPWVGLTDEERALCVQATVDSGDAVQLMCAIEAKLREKNT